MMIVIKKSVFFASLVLFSFIIFARGDTCESNDHSVIICPTKDYPEHYSRCCWKNDTMTCCAGPDSFVDDSLVMMISIVVILLCVTCSIFSVICCFWSPCPLYSVCRIKYTYGDIVAYNASKEEEALSLPPDNCRKKNYTPLHVKIKNVEED